MDLERAAEARGKPDRCGAGGLVLDDPDLAREHALADHASPLVDPRPDGHQRTVNGGPVETLYLPGRTQFEELPLRSPLRASGDEGQLALESNGHLASGRANPI